MDRFTSETKKHLQTEFQVRIVTPPSRTWRNWQTRYFEVVVG